MLQAGGLEPGGCPELLNRTKPELVASVHRAYAKAGSDVVITNTFGGTRLKLAEYGLEKDVEELNALAVVTAREATAGRCFVAASVGPTGMFVEPLGELTFDEAVGVFSEQMGPLAEAGADALHLETFIDVAELKAAMVAARLVPNLPVVAFMTFQADGRTVLGTDPETFAVVAEALGADAIGINCGLGPEAMTALIETLATATDRPLAVMPNAGLPRLEEGRTVFPGTPQELASTSRELVSRGVRLVGGCCGTTPDHLRVLAQAVKGLDPGPPRRKRGLSVSGRTRSLWVGQDHPVRRIGERLNPTGRKRLAEALRAEDWSVVRAEARAQADQGADLLDVNVGVPGLDEKSAMAKAVRTVQEAADLPLVIDSPDPDTLESGLRACSGKPVINSVNGERSSLERIIPLAARYGAALIGLTLDEEGIPETAAGRLAVARRIVEAAEAAGLSRRDLIIDCLVLTVSAKPEQALETLRAVEMVKEELGVATVLGVSNISFGLPRRRLINRTFLAQAVSYGLDAAIVDPTDGELLEALWASSVLARRDPAAASYCSSMAEEAPAAEEAAEGEIPTEVVSPEVWQAVLSGDKEGIVERIEAGLALGAYPIDLITGALTPALAEVGRRFEAGRLFLPQMMLAAETVQRAFERLKGDLAASDQRRRGRILLATVKGDIHDIGKNIVRTLLENNGYEIIDLGKNVPAEVIAEQAEAQTVDMVGLSALMTTTMEEMRTTVSHLRSHGLKMPIAVGGAVVTEAFAGEIGADLYAKDALQAVERIGMRLEADNLE
jgi:5-methyltetrahydrofolate--homocysteine methyltransferase